MADLLRFLAPHDMAFTGIYRDYLEFTLSRQLLVPELWADFVRVFTADSDDTVFMYFDAPEVTGAK